jgi:DNA-binding NarL/FixJ family response regulator
VVFTAVVVDDQADFRHVARALLEAGGYQVVGEAGSGAAAVAVAVAKRPQVVLLDVQLPDTDGFAVSRELSRLLPATAVILCSVRDAADYGDRVGRCGARGFLSKTSLSADAITRILADDG